MFHATNWTRLHESISIFNIRSILTTNESASEVGIVSENVWMVLAPFEIYIEKKNFFLVDIGKLS
jgi:hypothetical protein